jgi:hypothetical protein
LKDRLKLAEKFKTTTCDICIEGLAICSITGHGFGLCLDCYVTLVDKGIAWNEETKLEEIKEQVEGKPTVRVEPEQLPTVEA